MSKVIFTKEPQAFNKALAEALKAMPQFQAPMWSKIVKSGASRERVPASDTFWYSRSASILRQLYLQGVVGVGRLRTRYGSKKNRGGQRKEFRKAGGKIIRTILQQAEKAGLVEKVDKQQFGRRLTAKGRAFLDSINVGAGKVLDFESLKGVESAPADIQEIDEIEIDEEAEDND